MDDPPRPPQRKRASSVFEIPERRELMKHGSSVIASAWEPIEEPHTGKKKKTQFENTYKMDPSKKFRADLVQPIIESVLESNLDGRKYNVSDSQLLVKEMSEDIKQQVMDLHFDRYKLICYVSIGDKNEQGVYFGSRFLWDSDRDSYATANWSNRYIYAVATVYGLYFE